MVIGCQDFEIFAQCRCHAGPTSEKKKIGNVAFPSRNNNVCMNCSMENTDSSDV